jgi:hypothetical protein
LFCLRDLHSTYDPTALFKRYPHLNNLSSNFHHNAEKLTADYLGALKKHLLYNLQIQLGVHQAKETSLQFILTVPALWSEVAKEKTLKAAEEAGFGQDAPILVVSEPVSLDGELIKRYILTILRKQQQLMLSNAKSYVPLNLETLLLYVMLEAEQLI